MNKITIEEHYKTIIASWLTMIENSGNHPEVTLDDLKASMTYVLKQANKEIK